MHTRQCLHAGTCQWILDLPQFQSWAKAEASLPERLIWISALPGAGKSVLCSFLISHLQVAIGSEFGPVFFYMFDGRNVDKSSPLSATCSLVHQTLDGSRHVNEDLLGELDECRRESGQHKAADFISLWAILSKHIRKLSRVALLIDGLDECSDRSDFLENIIELLGQSSAKVIILSRREPDITRWLESFPQVTFGNKENQSDISSFLHSEILKSAKLNTSSVKRRIRKQFNLDLAEVLSARSDGSFLWARSAITELETKATTSEVLAAVEELPSGLIPFYESILAGYNKRFVPTQKRIVRIILRWLVCAARPMSGMELWEAVRTEYCSQDLESEDSADVDYSSDGSSDGGSDDEFHYTCREIEQMCGPLAVTCEGLVQLAHVSIAQFLRQKPHDLIGGEHIQDYFVNNPSANFHLTIVCIEYLQKTLGYPPAQVEDRGMKYRLDTTTYHSKPFLTYSVCQWQFHMVQTDTACLTARINKMRRFLLGPKVLYWLEVWFAIGGSLWALQQQMKLMLRRFTDQPTSIYTEQNALELICRWSDGFFRLLERHGSSLEEMPSEIHFIDPRSYDDLDETDSLFAELILPDPPVYTPHSRVKTRTFAEKPVKPEDVYVGSMIYLPPRDSHILTLFHVDDQRKALLMASYNTPTPDLRCLDLDSGQAYKPMRLVCDYDDDRNYFCEGFCISPDKDFLALLYRSYGTRLERPVKDRYDINIWRLAEACAFGDSGNASTWCRMVKSVSYYSPRIGYCARPLAFKDTFLYSPWGCIIFNASRAKEAAGQVESTRSDEIFNMSKCPLWLKDINISSDCRFMIAFSPEDSTLRKYSTTDLSVVSVATVAGNKIKICSVSHTGRFVVWRDMDSVQQSCCLYDFDSNMCTLIQDAEHISFPAHIRLKFTLDENHLIGIMGRPSPISGGQFISVWSALSTGTLRQATSIIVPEIVGLHLTNINEPAYLATHDHWVKVDFLSLPRLSPLLNPSEIERPYRHCKLSENGDVVALLTTTHQRCVGLSVLVLPSSPLTKWGLMLRICTVVKLSCAI